MITSYGVEHNAGWQNIQNEVVLDDFVQSRIDKGLLWLLCAFTQQNLYVA